MSRTHASPTSPTVSLLRMSAAQRVAGASVVLGMLWAAVAWALS